MHLLRHFAAKRFSGVAEKAPEPYQKAMANNAMQSRENPAGLFIVDNSDSDWKVRSYLTEWCELCKTIDIATGYFEIGSLLALEGKWQTVDHFRILMGDEVSLRTKRAFSEGLRKIERRLEGSLEAEKAKDDFLAGVPAIVEAIRAGKIECRVYRKDKFHAKAYITHGARGGGRLLWSRRLVEFHLPRPL